MKFHRAGSGVVDLSPTQEAQGEKHGQSDDRGKPTSDDGFWCLAAMAQYHRMPADPKQLNHDFGGSNPSTVREILRAAKALGLRARHHIVRRQRLPRESLPAIAVDVRGGFFILAGASDEKVLVQRPAERPQAITYEQLYAVWNSELVLVARREELAGADRRFDITWFIPAVYRYRKLFGDVVLASLFLQLFGLVTPLFFMAVVDKVLVHRGLTTLDVLVIGLILVNLFDALLGGLRTYLFSHTTSRVDVELGSRLFRHLTSLPIAYFAARQVGQTVARVRELETVRNFITSSSLTLLLDLFFTFVFFAVMFHFSLTLTLIVLCSVPLYVLLSLVITPPLRARVEEKFQRSAANQSFLVESVTGIETLKAMAVEPQMRQRWEEQLAAYVKASLRAIVIGTWGGQGVQLINKITLAAVLWFGAQEVIAGTLTVGQLVAFNMLSQQVSQPILRLAQLWQDFQQFKISLDKLGDVLNMPAEPTRQPGTVSPPALKGEVIFDHVTFRYRPDGPEVLKDLSFAVRPGEMIGVVGSSGSGKSTLTKLVQRLYTPESGQILIDGNNISLVDPAWLRRQVGVVLQENVLFNRTIRDNIALADPAMPIERVVAAAKLAGAHEFILELPNGYNAQVGERGTTLSGGQRQRIAIARALVMDPRILVFDEATSALDYESERIIQQNMSMIAQKRTVFIIAHRLSTVRHADRIITLEKGRIVEQGSHEELLKAGGRYAALHGMQSGEA